MNSPSAYPRRILLAVTGLSPQVVTETLYALALANEPQFIPTEIHLLTTSTGRGLARTALLHPDGGQFHALLADYPQLGRPVFDEDHIHVIQAADGSPLPDIRSPEENAAAADIINALVARLTSDEGAALHASIAGGRKTMGFYLGYAFSLHARPQDRLSHVLVSSPFENLAEFFFPPAVPRRLVTRGNHHVDTADAVVTLAEIPVVRLRHGLPAALQQGRSTYIQTVAAVQDSFAPPRLEIDLTQRRVCCGQRAIQLSPALVAWAAWWVDNLIEGRAEQSWREERGSTEKARAYLDIYALVVGPDATAFENAASRLQHGMEKEFFEQNNAKLERALRNQLGPAASPYLLATTGKRPHSRRCLSLPPEAVVLRR